MHDDSQLTILVCFNSPALGELLGASIRSSGGSHDVMVTAPDSLPEKVAKAKGNLVLIVDEVAVILHSVLVQALLTVAKRLRIAILYSPQSDLTVPEALRSAVVINGYGAASIAPLLRALPVLHYLAKPLNFEGRTPPRPTKGVSGLSPLEQAVASHLARGAANKEIARHLGIAEPTVKMHTAKIFEKLGVRNRTQAAVRLICG